MIIKHKLTLSMVLSFFVICTGLTLGFPQSSAAANSTLLVQLNSGPRISNTLYPTRQYRHHKQAYLHRNYRSQPLRAPHMRVPYRVGYNNLGLRKNRMGERKAGLILKKIQNRNPGTHFYSRHGAQTSLRQQKLRSITGITPDKTIGHPTHSFKWSSNVDLLHYHNKAKAIHMRSGQRTVDIIAPSIIGEGYLKGGKKLYFTRKARFIFDHGKLVTSFPIL